MLIALIERIILFAFYPPVSYNDSSSYRSLANAIQAGWVGYDGTRTPGYPMFLALVGPDQAVYLVQQILGLLVTSIFFFLGWKSTGRLAIGALAAQLHTLNLGQLFFEANLLTETLATFWLMCALLGAFVWYLRPAPGRRGILLAGAIGISSALAALTRPLYIFLPVWLALCLAVSIQNRRLRFNWTPLLGILIPAVIILGTWVNYINRNYHMMALTTMTGFHLVQHTGYYFEFVPDKYAALRDTFIRYRDARIAETGTAGNTIFAAIPEMMRVSGLSFYDLSRTLTRISIDLIFHHPDLYLKRAAKGWWYFWRTPFYWSPEQVQATILRPPLILLADVERVVLFACNLLFLATSMGSLFVRRLRRLWGLTPFMYLVATIIWITSVVQTLLDHGDNPRFLVPMQSWVVFWAAWIAYFSIRAWLKRGRPSPLSPSGIPKRVRRGQDLWPGAES
jgi:hypothetical protein